ncbi:hypothetical protein PR202_ga23041 [Eleusine coracana subsp. coracana]|uniref:Uncharacterized protein n=1 Tax=Eleusine coracana subsp. coracana TaxID=191504 RepID=A0AAV5D4T9_ELECO|nr:hypothetical protein PR202_ga23041 [Eleusine coracana subsp. coracana]
MAATGDRQGAGGKLKAEASCVEVSRRASVGSVRGGELRERRGLASASAARCGEMRARHRLAGTGTTRAGKGELRVWAGEL